jgi:UDP-3-O-[3-hydroxymyristoyl] glucosamine N-acyltransferase
MSKTIKTILDLLTDDEPFQFYGNNTTSIHGVKNITEIQNNYASYSTSTRTIPNNRRNALLVTSDKQMKQDCNIILTSNPRYIFAQILNMFRDYYPDDEPIIGKNFRIGEQCVLKNCIIGDNVKIHSGTIIGESGFGYVKNSSETKTIEFPHYGKAIIGDNVNIHSNCCVDRGSLTNTIIEENCKFDNFCHIAHNDVIGKFTMVSARTMVSGGVTIGRHCWIGSGSSIIDKITIEHHTFLGTGSNVIKSITEPYQTWAGNPARRLK